MGRQIFREENVIDLSVQVGYGNTTACGGEREEGWIEQRNVTENSRCWGVVEYCVQSQDKMGRTGLRLM